jgi:hypothetical protein
MYAKLALRVSGGTLPSTSEIRFLDLSFYSNHAHRPPLPLREFQTRLGKPERGYFYLPIDLTINSREVVGYVGAANVDAINVFYSGGLQPLSIDVLQNQVLMPHAVYGREVET